MDEKRKRSWMLLAAIFSVAVGMVASVVKPLIASESYQIAFVIVCAVIAFGPIPFAYRLELKNYPRTARGTTPAPVWIVSVLCAALIIVISLAVIF